MFRNYLRTTLRHLRKNKTFTLINITGLSIGMAACLLILQYSSFELSFDRFNRNAADIYRVTNDRYQNGKLIQHGTITYSAIGKAMQDDYPEVIDHTRVEPWGTNILSVGDKKIGELEQLTVENAFLRMFSYPMLAGDAKTALEQPFSAVLTDETAKKLYGPLDGDWHSYLGKTFIHGTDSMPYKVTGILSLPENSHLQFSYLISYATLLSGSHPWTAANYDFKQSDFWHYVQLRPGADYKELEAKFPAFSDRHFQGNKVSGSVEKFALQPLLRAHLYSDYEYDIGRTSSATVVWGLLAVGILVILIAWFNYINLTTAKSMERAKEVGVRKVAGATRGQLVSQFLTESLILNIVSLAIAVLIVLLAQSGLNKLVHHKLSLGWLFERGWNGYGIGLGLTLLLLAGILISGFYPALVLSAFRPIAVLKGKFTGSGKGAWLRRTLVTGQFAITIILTISAFFVYKQLKFVSQQDLGMRLSQIISIRGPHLTKWDSTFINRENTFAAEVGKIAGVRGVAMADQDPGGDLGRVFDVKRPAASSDQHFTMRILGISAGYIPMFGIKLLGGRNFVETDYSSQWGKLHNLILNESAVHLLGFKSLDEALGRQIQWGGRTWDIVGVINDIHQKSLRFAMEPTIYDPVYGNVNPISVKVDPRDLAATIEAIHRQYDAYFPGNLFDYHFVDEKFASHYADDQLFGKVFGLFSALAILIACLGLFGLSLFATFQRTKEIGVRKVLGASLSNIMLLLSRDFFRLLLVANLIAFPLAWMFMQNWLKDFAYRTNLSWWVFVGAGGLAVVIALATISVHALRAARANPARSLRTE